MKRALMVVLLIALVLTLGVQQSLAADGNPIMPRMINYGSGR